MIITFHSPAEIAVRTSDGRNFVLMQDIEFSREDGARFRMPIGSTTDGASTPPEIWPTIPPFGDYWLACVVHDGAYRGALLRMMTNGFWAPAMLSKEDSDLLLLDIMTSCRVDMVKREAIYEGVKLGGWKAFQADRFTV